MRGFDPGCYYSTSEMIFKFKLKSVLLVVHSRAHSHNLWKIENKFSKQIAYRVVWWQFVLWPVHNDTK